MNFIISENKMFSLIDKYMKVNYPNFYDLSKSLTFAPYTTASYQKQIGYVFTDDEADEAIFYWTELDSIHPDDETYNKIFYPELNIPKYLWEDIHSVFGDSAVQLIKTWFTQVYELPVNTLDW